MLIGFKLTVKDLVFLLYISIGFAPRTEMFKNAAFPLVVVFPITTFRGTVGVKGCTGLNLGLLFISGIFRFFGVLNRLFSLIFEFYYLISTVNRISF